MESKARRLSWLSLVLPAVVLFAVVVVCNDPLGLLAKPSQKPVDLLEAGLRRVERISDFRCVFTKQERVDRQLKPQQKMRVLYRDEPTSVFMEWLENAGKIRKALWVEGQHRTRDGHEQVVVEPAGALARAFAPQVKVKLHGKRAKQASRRTLDEFGFRQMLERIVRETRRYETAGVLTWGPVEPGQVDGRATWVIEQRLPADTSEQYPFAKLVVQLDQEWMLPVRLTMYADHAGEQLLEHYEMSEVELNCGLDDADFRL